MLKRLSRALIRPLFAVVDTPTTQTKSDAKIPEIYSGGYSIVRRDSGSRTDYDAFFEHAGHLPIHASDRGGGGGGGGIYQRGRLLLDSGGSGQGYSRETDDAILSKGEGLGYVDLGLIALRGRWLRIFPLIGFGGLGSGASVLDKRSMEDEKKEIANMSASAAEAHIGLGADVLLPVARWRLVVGVRVGYRLFNLEFNRDPARSVDPRATGFYWRVIAGLETRARKDD